MTEPDVHPEIDPLNDSDENVRLKIAEARLAHHGGEAGTPESVVAKKKQNLHFDSSYQNTLFSSAGSLGKPAWSDSMTGRAMIRMLSRGVAGALFFTIGGRMSRMQLSGYDSAKTFRELDSKKPLQWIAKGFDIVFGKPISSMTRAGARLGGLEKTEADLLAWKAVNFRTKAYYHTMEGQLNAAGMPKNARSLGAEMVSISFDFAMMSVGDAMIRNFIQMIDPNLKKTWLLNDKGQIAGAGEAKHFSLGKWVQATGKAAWRIVSKNQGEDWAVALPYVYQMKMQRHIIGKAFDHKGSKIFLDNSWNGGAYKLNAEGKIIGDYNLIGAMDLHARFVGYNVYTLMFREGYDAIANNLKKWKENHYAVHLSVPQHPLHSMKEAFRYVVKSTIKGNMYMNPAVIPFWLFRVPQTKWRAAAINVEARAGENALLSKTKYSDRLAEQAHMVVDVNGKLVQNHNTTRDRVQPYEPGNPQAPTAYVGDREVNNEFHGITSPNDKSLYKNFSTNTWWQRAEKKFSQAVNPFGQVCFNAGTRVSGFVERNLAETWFGKFAGMNESKPYLTNAMTGEYLKDAKGSRILNVDSASRERFMRTMVDASFAYTPYFYAKTEFGLRVDDHPKDGGPGKMDTAIYSFMDNVAGLKLRKAGGDIKRMVYLSTHDLRDPIMREGSAVVDETPVPATPVQTPKTTIATKETRHHAPVELSRAPETAADASSDETDRSWAKAMWDRKNAVPYLADVPQTRH